MTDTILAKYAHPKGNRINIGSGYYIQEGYIGLDNGIGFNTQLPENGRMPDMMIDLCNEKWPFPDESCFEVYSSHSFEHFSNTEYILQEAHRILKPNHIFKIIVPYANSAEGMYPGHDVFYTEKWFNNNLNVNCTILCLPAMIRQRSTRRYRHLFETYFLLSWLDNFCSMPATRWKSIYEKKVIESTICRCCIGLVRLFYLNWCCSSVTDVLKVLISINVERVKMQHGLLSS